MAMYVRQLETLDKHRGKGQQKITVEHVTVNAVGRGIVSNVTTGTAWTAWAAIRAALQQMVPPRAPMCLRLPTTSLP